MKLVIDLLFKDRVVLPVQSTVALGQVWTGTMAGKGDAAMIVLRFQIIMDCTAVAIVQIFARFILWFGVGELV